MRGSDRFLKELLTNPSDPLPPSPLPHVSEIIGVFVFCYSVGFVRCSPKICGFLLFSFGSYVFFPIFVGFPRGFL